MGTTYTAATGVSADTDGYQIAASMTWLTTWTTKSASTIVTSTDTGASATSNVVIGTCVETLTSASAALATTVTTEGNFAICHWMYALYSVNTAVTTLSGTTKAGGGGTSLTNAANGLTFGPAAAASTTLTAQ